MTKFKVGDRVRVTDESGSAAYKVGEVGTVARVTSVEVGEHTQLVELEGKNGSAMFGERFEPVAAAPAAATLTVRAGAYYKTRDGRKVGPMEKYDHDSWHSPESGSPLSYGLWKDSGAGYYSGASDSPDLVAEWVDEPAAVAPATAAEPEEPAPYTAPAVGDDVLIPGWVTAINTSRKGTVYSIAFETKNRRVSLNFTEEDFIPVDPDDECPCFAENDNGPLPIVPNTAAAFDDLCGSIFGLTMRAA